MGKIIPNSEQRAIERTFANPANRARALAQQQQGAISGQVPGTTSPYNQTGVAYGLVQPPTTGDKVAAVGHAVLANDGSPVVVMGNLHVTAESGKPPSAFQDGGLVLTDETGNAVAGYSHPTGMWGFGVQSVTDGTTTVNPASELDFTSGATVTDGGSGIAQVAITGGGGGTPQLIVANFAVYSSTGSPPLADLGLLPFSVVIAPPMATYVSGSVTYPYVPLSASDFFAISLLQPSVDVTLAAIDICVFNAALTELLDIRATIPLPHDRDNAPTVPDYSIINQIGADLSAYATNTGAQSGILSAAGGNYAATCSVAVMEP